MCVFWENYCHGTYLTNKSPFGRRNMHIIRFKQFLRKNDQYNMFYTSHFIVRSYSKLFSFFVKAMEEKFSDDIGVNYIRFLEELQVRKLSKI
jgi:hypothetical protein